MPEHRLRRGKELFPAEGELMPSALPGLVLCSTQQLSSALHCVGGHGSGTEP